MTTRNPFADKFATTKIKSLSISLTTYYCGDRLAYKMYVKGKLLFQGFDFKPAPCMNWDSLETNITLLGFLSVGIHDTDAEYFENYIGDQIDWANDTEGGITIREQLSGLVSDAEDKYSEYYLIAIKEFKHKTY